MGGTPTIVVGVADDGKPDLALVDALARLALVARRGGGRVVLRGAPDELRDLVVLAGLAGVLGLEPRRKAERGEQLGVEEVVQPRDPPG